MKKKLLLAVDVEDLVEAQRANWAERRVVAHHAVHDWAGDALGKIAGSLIDAEGTILFAANLLVVGSGNGSALGKHIFPLAAKETL